MSDIILVVLEEHAGIISHIKSIYNNVVNVITQSPKEHSGLVIGVILHGLIPHFLAGDHMKDHWSDCIGIVVAINDNIKKLMF